MAYRILALALVSGCTLLGVPEEHVLSVDNNEVVLADGETRLSFRSVHAVQRLDASSFVEDGLPYVSLNGAWLEIASSLTIANGGYQFEIENTGCETEERSCGDCSYDAVASCTVVVDTSSDSSRPKISATSFSHDFSLADQYATTARTTVGDDLLAVRSTGFYVGSFDVASRTVASATASIDIVTSFGVANLDLEANPIIGHQETVTIGPQQARVTVIDIGNTNTHCEPPPVGCQNVFDLHLDLEGAGAETARVIDYR